MDQPSHSRAIREISAEETQGAIAEAANNAAVQAHELNCDICGAWLGFAFDTSEAKDAEARVFYYCVDCGGPKK